MRINKFIKTITTLALAATVSFTTLAVPTAAAWQTTDNGKQWVNTDGTIAKSKWLTMKNGDRYYIKSNGIMATGLLTLSEKINGKKVKNTYYFDKQGKMQTGWQLINKKYYYFNTKTGRAYKNTNKINGYTLNFSDKGVWDQKLYKNNKDVTTDALIEQLTGIALKRDTITIAGQTYSTKLKTLTLNQPNLTDEDLEVLKYMTNLRGLDIVPGSIYAGEHGSGSRSWYDYSNPKLINTTNDRLGTRFEYEVYAKVRSIGTEITNLNFCSYLTKLEEITICYAPRLTDVTGLVGCTKLHTVVFYNCTALKDLHAFDNKQFVKTGIGDGISVQFSDNVKYVFTDYNFGSRLKTPYALFIVKKSEGCMTGTSRSKLNTAEDCAKNFTPKTWLEVIKRVYYLNNVEKTEHRLGM